MFSFENIYKCYLACRKHKRNSNNQLEFEKDLILNLWQLKYDLDNKEYKISKSICFLTSSPKLREVFASSFRDRIVHHILVRELEKYYEPKFIHDVYNNRKGKGIHQATKRCQKFMHSVGDDGYYLQLDIKGFFYNIDKNILFMKIFNDLSKIDEAEAIVSKSKGYGALAPAIGEAKAVTSEKQVGNGALAPSNIKKILWLSNKIIYHNYTKNYIFQGDKSNLELLPPHKTLFKIPKSKGLPIGNLTSQFFANIYMNEFDNWIKRKLKVKYYIRYVDDFVLFAKSLDTTASASSYIDGAKKSTTCPRKSLDTTASASSVIKLQEYKREIEIYLSTLGLELRRDSKLQRFNQGLDFLGYVIRPNYILVRKRVVNNYKVKKARYLNEYERQKGKMSLVEIKEFLSVQSSFVGHIKHANSYNLKQKVGQFDDKKYINLICGSWSTQR